MDWTASRTSPLHHPGFFQTSADKFALQIDLGIDLVGKSFTGAVIAYDGDVVRRRADPEFPTFGGDRRFPQSQMMTLPDNLKGNGARQSVVLRPVEQNQDAHRRVDVRLPGRSLRPGSGAEKESGGDAHLPFYLPFNVLKSWRACRDSPWPRN